MKEQAIAAVVTPVVEQCGLEVDRIEVLSAGKRSLLRIALDGDGPDGRGPSLDEIADATRAISAALDAGDVTGAQPYTLEVSTRGVSRPLTEPRHFRRNVGRLVALTLPDGKLTARILSADDDGITVVTDDGGTRSVPFGEVRRAVVQVELRSGETDDEEE